MSVVIVKRPPRSLPRAVPSESVRLQPPPGLPRGGDQGLLMAMLPMLGMAGSAAYFFTTSQPIMMMMGGLMLASSGAMAVAQFVKMRRGAAGSLADTRREYLTYLSRVREQVRATAEQQRGAQLFTHPAPEQLWSLVSVTGGPGNRVWERRPTDPDFAQVRFGLGPQPLATALIAPQAAPTEGLEPLAEHALDTFVRTHAQVEDLPLVVSLRAFYHLTLSGERATVYGTARAVLSQLATLHGPDDLVIAVVADPAGAPEWEWTKWLPHAQRPGTSDGAGTRRLLCGDLGDLETMLAKRLEDRPRFGDDRPLLDKPHIVVVLDGGAVPQDSVFAAAEGLQGVTVIEVVPGDLGRPRGGLSVVVQPGRLTLEAADGSVYEGVPDVLSEAETETLARHLAPLRMGSGGADDEEPLLADLDFTDLLGLGDAGAVDPARTWRPRSTKDRLRVPIGVGENGEPVLLDIKEAALEGMGPHGLCVGATGSGKSELLRTLVLGLAVTHSSETLNFVLADFKGGATFAGMAQMPHVSAVITNLADDLTLVDRMRDSITGELQRRQELLAATGQKDITSYEKARAAGSALEPLPNLLLIIDEFSELLTEKPDFIDMFIQIGRIGRSLGVHLLLASQRLEEGRLRGLDTYLSYRIGLRTFSASESRAALGVPDAYHLPSVPGSGYLKFGTDTMVRFKAAYVSGPYRSRGAVTATGPLPPQRRPVLFTAAEVPVPEADPQPAAAPAAETESSALADTVLDVIVRRLEGQGAPAHEVWLPPLAEAPSLDQLLPPLAVTAGRGLTSPGLPGLGALDVPLGIVDKPFEQRRDLLRLDFSGAAGHLLVVGGPRSGKSTLVRTLISSFALTHTPAEVQFYGLDFGGGGMLALNGLPHVGGVASRLDTEKVRRTVAEVAGILNRREEFFRANAVDSITTYRRRRAAGDLPGEQWGDVFLVIDGWMSFRSDYELLESVVTDIASRGLGFGVHVVLTATRYSEVRPALKDQVQARLELRLGDPMESEFDRKVAQNVPATAPGRGLSPQRLHFLTGLPRIDASAQTGDLSDGTAALVAAVEANWTGPRAPEVRMLPATLPAHQLPKGSDYPQHGVAIGIDEVALEPAFVNFDTDPHFIVFGESESGKTAVLRLLIKQITERYTPEQGRIIMVDYRRTLLGAVPETHLVEFAASAPALEQFVGSIRGALAARVPNSEVTQEQLRNRSWWSGPEMFLIIDDYELVAASNNPLGVLVDLLPLAKDIGLHVILARNSAGASRSLYESFMNRLRELSTQGLLLSGDRDEGALLGNVKPTRLPPGRGFHVTRRRGSQLIQTGWLPER
ncbi:type VII secretion protein EccCa [Actinacidiphila acididurans]|uniref:Type VII secretion protein EccCa n=1 Tax=Actinacidiphila acididurans TaxID=2784346 RepID=A0ABS2TKZ5_9ACTN|nr:type VII secretion protein EccCa [Actinacidiphila acididurans]MBM9504004.1 type VII secretion protein EccCa [Actinacidiphila acididurans]